MFSLFFKKMKKTESIEDLKLSGWKELLKTEDYWSIWLGCFLMAMGLFIYLFIESTQRA
jgi:hypothetical protein